MKFTNILKGDVMKTILAVLVILGFAGQVFAGDAKGELDKATDCNTHTGTSFDGNKEKRGTVDTEMKQPVSKVPDSVESFSIEESIHLQDNIKLAGGCSDACKYNYDQCMRGCDGAGSCGNQCQRNYEGCMGGCR
jgi:hypothetical protein